MTTCSNCGSLQGPFNRTLTGYPICVKLRRDMAEAIKGIRACNQRRDKIDKGNEDGRNN